MSTRRRPPLARARRAAGETFLALLIVASTTAQLRYAPDSSTVLGATAAALPAAFLWMRRTRPLAVLVACTVLFCVVAFQTWLNSSSLIPLTCAVYGYSVATDRRRAATAAGLVIVVTVPVTLVAMERTVIDPLPVLVAVAVGFAAALGDGIRNRRAYLAELQQRALIAEATRESEAARRVSEERLRIARDLHDVVAHQISVISLNAGVASSALATRPAAAQEALHTIRTASRQVLGDIGDLLAVLRTGEEGAGAPQPGLAQLGDLIDGFRRAGLDITLRSEGEAPALSPSTDVVAYRVLQEGLTNALKHAAARRAHILITGAADRLTLLVTNPVGERAPSGAPTGGHGLQGVRERVSAVRGTVRIGAEGGVFRLEAVLPAAGGETT